MEEEARFVRIFGDLPATQVHWSFRATGSGFSNLIHPRKLTWNPEELVVWVDVPPLKKGGIFRFQPLVFRGVSTRRIRDDF